MLFRACSVILDRFSLCLRAFSTRFLERYRLTVVFVAVFVMVLSTWNFALFPCGIYAFGLKFTHCYSLLFHSQQRKKESQEISRIPNLLIQVSTCQSATCRLTGILEIFRFILRRFFLAGEALLNSFRCGIRAATSLFSAFFRCS